MIALTNHLLIFVNVILNSCFSQSITGDKLTCDLQNLPSVKPYLRAADDLDAICGGSKEALEAHLLCCIKYRFTNPEMLAVRPSIDYFNPVRVAVNFKLSSNDQIKVKYHGPSFELTVMAQLSWSNNFIDWTGSSHNISKISLDPKKLKIWRPGILNVNADGSARRLDKEGSTMTVSLTTVTMNLRSRLSATCAFKGLENFPFDKQLCFLDFASIDPPQLVIFDNVTLSTELPNSVQQGDSEWTVSKPLLSNRNYDFSTKRRAYRIELLLTRNYAYWLVQLIIPSILLAGLQLSTFLVPVFRAERPGYSAFITLVFASMLLQVKSELPKTSIRITVLIYLLTQFTIGCFVTFFSIIMNAKYSNHFIANRMSHLKGTQIATLLGKGSSPLAINFVVFVFLSGVTLASHYLLYTSAFGQEIGVIYQDQL